MHFAECNNGALQFVNEQPEGHSREPKCTSLPLKTGKNLMDGSNAFLRSNASRFSLGVDLPRVEVLSKHVLDVHELIPALCDRENLRLRSAPTASLALF